MKRSIWFLYFGVVLAGCGAGNPGYRSVAVNPAFANEPTTPVVWVEPIACEHNAPDPSQAAGLQLQALTHPNQIRASRELAAAACSELMPSGGLTGPVDKSWHGSAALTNAVTQSANGASLAVVVGNDDACIPSTPHECDDSPSLKSWAVFVFGPQGTIRKFHRRDPMYPGTGDGPGDVAGFAEK